MFQDASTEPVLNPRSKEDAPSPEGAFNGHPMLESAAFSADSDASRLMDDLFQDLDQLLGVERDTFNPKPPEPIFAPAPVAAAPSISQPFDQQIDPTDSGSLSSSSLVPFPESALPQVDPAAEPGELSEITESAVAEPEEIAQPVPQERSRFSVGSYDRLLLGIGCISVIVTLALWLLYQERHRPLTPVAVAPATTAASPNSQDASRFADYVQKSLQNIDQQQAGTAAQAPATTTGKMSTVNIPATTAPSAAASGTSQPATGLSRIYVPVYEFPSNFTPPGTAIAPLPGAPRKTTLPPGTVRPNPAPNTAFTLPFGTNPGALPSVKPNQIPSPAVATVSRKLVGVLDQGNRSAALFEVNGVTQRYEIGESIGSSGWTLVEVTKDQALIRRNGEVRSLFVGHGF
jgi:hypothetical protein